MKRLLFQRAGVPEYWIVDLDARLVERWRPDAATAPLEIDLPGFFAQVLGD